MKHGSFSKYQNPSVCLWSGTTLPHLKTQKRKTKPQHMKIDGRMCLIHIEFMPREETINSTAYCETLQQLRRAIRNKRCGMLPEKVFLIHDNDRPHAFAQTQQELPTS